MTRRSFPSPPTSARALILRAHPDPDSFNHALAVSYAEGLEAGGVVVQTLDLASLTFDPIYHGGYSHRQPLEPDLVRVQEAVAAAAHVVVAFPVWWGSTPAVLKGLFDRAFEPGWAFRYDNHRPVAGLGGRSGRLLVTMDAPTWYDAWVYRASARRQVGRATLQFCGIRPVKTSAFGSVGTSTASTRQSMLEAAFRAAGQDAMRLTRRFPRHALGVSQA